MKRLPAFPTWSPGYWDKRAKWFRPGAKDTYQLRCSRKKDHKTFTVQFERGTGNLVMCCSECAERLVLEVGVKKAKEVR